MNLVQYVRNKHGVPIGVVVATLMEDQQVSIGWSLCRKGDMFKKKTGRMIALGRAVTQTNKPVPRAVEPVYMAVAGAAIEYFKNANLDRLHECMNALDNARL